MTAILFGSIGTLADTSELQREAFNAAFELHGVDWHWDRAEYQQLLAESGGVARIGSYAQTHGPAPDAVALHATKSEIFQQRLRDGGVRSRADVPGAIGAAREAGLKVALVTTTSPENIAALGEALAPEVDIDAFDLVLSAEDVSEPKPSPEVYALALERLGEQPGNVVAIEDNIGGMTAALAAGLRVIAFPGENNADGDFGAAQRRVEILSASDLSALAGRGEG